VDRGEVDRGAEDVPRYTPDEARRDAVRLGLRDLEGSTMSQVVVFGTGTVARLAYAYVSNDSPHEIAAFTVDRDHMAGDQLFGHPVVPFDEVANLYPAGEFDMFVAVGYALMNKFREQRYLQAKAMGYRLISYISSRATFWSDYSSIGDNCFIMENNVIQPFVEIGNDVLMWSGSQVGHNSVIKDHCSVASQVVVSGNVVIEPNCFLGVNATIRDGVTIARECVIGAGALILNDTKEREVYVGPKAKLLPMPSNRIVRI
jgi:sugar O-acyltransferase (sialic acid O-acetyltransferase NeuD family)